MYQLVFRGECTQGTDQAQARANAKALFKASVDQVERMFSGRPVVIRNRLQQEQAEKYQAVLARHGMVAYVQPMAGEAPGAAEDAAGAAAQGERAASAGATAASSAVPPAVSQPAPAAPESVKVEPGDRLPVAGDRVDEVLAGSALSLDPVGTRLAEHQDVEVPMFQHIDDWSLAPAGSDLGVPRELPPPVVPDVSHLSLVPQATDTDPDH